VVEPQVPLEELPLFERALTEGRLRSRTTVALFHDRGANGDRRRALLDAVQRHPVDPTGGSPLQLGPLKLYIDDVIEPHGAAMIEDYANRPGHRGATFYEPTEFMRLIAELDRMGFQTHTHATGDRGVRVALDAIEHAATVNGTSDRRHGIVHVECLHPGDISRFRDLGVVACMQPRHCSPDFTAGSWMENVGEDRWGLAWAFRSLAQSGAPLAFSSDWQVAEMDPLIGIYTALTRASLDGMTSWVPDQTIDLDTALAAYTRGGAWAWHAEDRLGTLEAGKLADLVMLSGDPDGRDPESLLHTEVATTVVGGETIYAKG
jgi:predicted amidohydrolase YtcJ